jgi:hypothetical protein
MPNDLIKGACRDGRQDRLQLLFQAKTFTQQLACFLPVQDAHILSGLDEIVD